MTAEIRWRPIIPGIASDKKERGGEGEYLPLHPIRNEGGQDKYGKEGLKQMATGYTDPASICLKVSRWRGVSELNDRGISSMSSRSRYAVWNGIKRTIEKKKKRSLEKRDKEYAFIDDIA